MINFIAYSTSKDQETRNLSLVSLKATPALQTLLPAAVSTNRQE